MNLEIDNRKKKNRFSVFARNLNFGVLKLKTLSWATDIFLQIVKDRLMQSSQTSSWRDPVT